MSSDEARAAGARWAAGHGPIHKLITRRRMAALAERMAEGGMRGDGVPV
jgi:hypothetical protein